ncbi:MAG: sigma-70 family RNA polymerase sigma factor [Phycisphaerales bacterium]
MTTPAPDARQIYAILVREHADALLVYLRATVPSSAVDDLFQEAVLVAWRRLADFDRSRPFGPWLRGIARNLVLDWRSRAGRMQLSDPATLDQIERSIHALERRPGDSFDDRIKVLEECLEALAPEQAEVVQLAYRSEQPLAAIARQVQANEETVKKRLQRARALLADCMTRKGALA